MPRVRPRPPHPEPNRQRALALLASCRAGCTEVMAAHGFSILDMVELVFAGLATVSTKHIVVGRRRMEVRRLRITEAGRRALAS
jgi:hypothetical protein